MSSFTRTAPRGTTAMLDHLPQNGQACRARTITKTSQQCKVSFRVSKTASVRMHLRIAFYVQKTSATSTVMPPSSPALHTVREWEPPNWEALESGGVPCEPQWCKRQLHHKNEAASETLADFVPTQQSQSPVDLDTSTQKPLL